MGDEEPVPMIIKVSISIFVFLNKFITNSYPYFILQV